MNAFAESLGIDADAVTVHVREFADYWQSATKNATSMDWLKRWRSRFSQDIREGKIGPNGRASPNGMNGNGRPSVDRATNEIRTDLAVRYRRDE